jgi:hypothetical protein
VSEDSQAHLDVTQAPTGAGWMRFFQYAIDKHQLSESQVAAYRTVARRVLAVEDDPDSVDIANLDEDDLLRRFRIKNKTSLTEQSFATYESRFRRGRIMYLKWLNNEHDWAGKQRRASRPSVKPTLNGQGGGVRKAATVPVQQAFDEAPAIDAMTASVASAQPELLDYPVPLVDSNVTAILRLPRNYTTGDATRMTALINALAIPSNTGSSSPSSDA